MSKEFYRAASQTDLWPNLPSYTDPGALSYDDVLLMPRARTKIESRSQVDLSVRLGPFNLSVPLIAAPMDTIVGGEMAREIARLGGVAAYPRGDITEVTKVVKQFTDEGLPILPSIGLRNGEALKDGRNLAENGAQAVLIDVAHGGMDKLFPIAHQLMNIGLTVIAGNIVTYEQAISYKQEGVNIARVGVGPGAHCTTREMTGVGYPQLSAIFETTEAGLYVIADGGIKNPGDVAKALAAGAKAVMIGSWFGGTDETPGEFNQEGLKMVRGQASASASKEYGAEIGEFRAAEGAESWITRKGPVKDIVNQITGGLRSAFSYVGASNLEEFYEKAVFRTVSPSVQTVENPARAARNSL